VAFTVPAVVLSRNSAGSVTSTTGTFSAAIPASTPLTIGISVSSDTPAISSVGPDSKGNVYALVGHQVTTTGQPVWIYRSWVTTPLTTSDTLAVTISSAAVINVIAVASPGTAFIPLQFTGGNGTAAAAAFQLAVPALPSDANGWMLAFSVNASAAPAWLTPGPTVLTTTSGGGGPFFSCAYEDAGDFPATLEIDMSPTSTASMAVTALMSDYTDLYADVYGSLYGQYSGATWPGLPGGLEVLVELLLNGTWTDVTAYAYQRNGGGITITRGRPDESSRLVTAQCSLQFNNRNGAFSSKNTASPFYPYITRNTQLRVSVPVSYNSTDAGMAVAFSGEVPSWPPSWDVSGNDVWVDVTASGISRRLNQQATIGSALKRFYLQKPASDPLYPIAYWPCEDGSGAATLAEVTATQAVITFTGAPSLASDGDFGGSDPIPVLNNSVWTSTVGAYGDPGSATFTVPGTHPFTPRAGLTAVTAEAWGGGGGGTNGWQANLGKDAAGGGGEQAKDVIAVTGGSTYTATVGAGGEGGPLSRAVRTIGPFLAPVQRQGTDGGTSRFVGDAGAQVVAHGGKGGTFTGNRAGAGGTGSTNGTHHNGGAGGKNSGSLFGGSGGGSSGGSSAAGNNGGNGGASNTGAAGGAAVTGGGKGGKGGNGGASVDQGGTAGSLPGGGGGSGGENSGNTAGHSGGNGGAGMVKLTWTPLTSPAYNVLRFLLHVPAGGDANNAVVDRKSTRLNSSH